MDHQHSFDTRRKQRRDPCSGVDEQPTPHQDVVIAAHRYPRDLSLISGSRGTAKLGQDLVGDRALPEVAIDLAAALRAGAKDFKEMGALEGYFGRPHDATAEEGEALYEEMARIVVEVVG